MKFWEALFYPYTQRGWPGKMLIAVALGAIPLLNLVMIKAWDYEISTRVNRGQVDDLLPGWKDATRKLWRGLGIRFAEFIYKLPSYIILIVSLALWVQLFWNWITHDQRTWATWIEMFNTGLHGRLLLFAVALPAWFIGTMLYSASYVRFIHTGKLLTFLEIWPSMKAAFANIWDDVMLTLYLLILNIVLWVVGGIAAAALASTGIGIIAAVWLIPAAALIIRAAFEGHLYGQLARRTPFG